MGLSKSSLSDAVRPLVLDVSPFSSGLPSEGVLENAALDPAKNTLLFGDRTNPEFASILQRNAVTLAQASQALSANDGLSSFASFGDAGLEAVVGLVSESAYANDVNVLGLATLGVESIIDTIVEGPLGSVPFVGAAAKTLWAIGTAVFEAAGDEAALPPLFRMDSFSDDLDTKAAIRRVRGASGDDWTPIFLPQMRGRWRMDEADVGFVFVRDHYDELYDDGITRLGCAPGDLFYVDGGVQSRITTSNVTIPSNSKNPRHSNIIQTGENPRSLHSLVFPLGEWKPSLSAFARSVWSLAGTRGSTAMFQIDADQVADEWAQFAGAAAAFRADMDKHLDRRIASGSKSFKRSIIAAYLGNVGAALHTLRARDSDGKLRELNPEQLLAAALDPGKRAGADTVGRQAVQHAKKLLKRQRQAIRTPLNGLVSANAPAFRNNPKLREELLEERTKLLDAGRLDGLVLEEVPDPNLRKRIATRGQKPGGDMPTGFADPVSSEKKRQHAAELSASLKTIDKPDGFGGYGAEADPDDESGGGFGLAIAGLVATAGLAAGGVALARRRR